MVFVFWIGILLVALKMLGLILWPWMYVLVPFWFLGGFFVLTFLLAASMAGGYCAVRAEFLRRAKDRK